MFTGIIIEAGRVESIKPAAQSIRLTVRARAAGRGLKPGASVAVNGCCLTATKISKRGKDNLVQFVARNTATDQPAIHRPGSLVDLERPLRADAELGGHFVTGHIDGVGRIIRWERVGRDQVLDIAAPPDVMRYVVFKGSVPWTASALRWQA
jgi:riboflavin synthase